MFLLISRLPLKTSKVKTFLGITMVGWQNQESLVIAEAMGGCPFLWRIYLHKMYLSLSSLNVGQVWPSEKRERGRGEEGRD